MKKTVGILGGMGPEATAYFYDLITKYTHAEKDQDHIPIIIYSNPQVPPRTNAIVNKHENPLPYLLEGVRILHQAGADFIVMPCITAHYYYSQIVGKYKIPFLNLLDETLYYMGRKMPNLSRAGLIASTGTLKSKLFHNSLAMGGIEIIIPTPEEQSQVMEAIFGRVGIKAGYTTGKTKETIHFIAKKLIQRGAQVVIAGCTEIPLVLKEDDILLPLIDPLKIMAQACIVNAGYEIRKDRVPKTAKLVD